MVFNSYIFLIFFSLLVVLLFVLDKHKWKKVLYLIFSYVFYMWWNPLFILLIIFSTCVDYFIGSKISTSESKFNARKYLFLSIALNLGFLAFFKYANLLSSSFYYFFQGLGYSASWTELNIILPVGISFYTFQTLSYSIDIYKKEIEPVESALDFAVFVSFFPQLVAGPIIRASDFLPQLKKKKSVVFDKSSLLLVTKGLFKKVVIADNLGLFVDAIYSEPDAYPSVIVWMATIAFSIQIYCDFSGYTDMAIGIAALLGFKFPPNFDRPYFSKTPSEFWRKWHISLSTWLRDYLYIPLGGNRSGRFGVYRNLMITMLLGGLWHGASWNFVLWGGLHGAILVLYRIFSLDRILLKDRGNRLLKILSATFIHAFVLLTWIVFRQEDFGKMTETINKFLFFDFNFDLAGIGLGRLSFFSSLLLIIGFWIGHGYSWVKGGIEERWLSIPDSRLFVYLFLMGAVLYFFWPTSSPPFIYFQF